jgi:fumarate reductase subunit D
VPKSNEAFFWSLFSVGGTITALLLPVLIVVTGFLVPSHQVAFHRLHEIFSNPFGRIILFGLALFTFFLCAQRLRKTLVDVGLRSIAIPINLVFNLAALAATVWAGVVAFT